MFLAAKSLLIDSARIIAWQYKTVVSLPVQLDMNGPMSIYSPLSSPTRTTITQNERINGTHSSFILATHANDPDTRRST